MATISSELTKTFIEKSKLKHNDIFDYSLVEYINSKTKVKIKCKEHGEFEQTPNNHLRGQKCPFCNGKSKSNSIEFIKLSKKINNDKYDYSLVEYINSKTKVRIICKEHGEFEQTPNKHLNGQGCAKCKGKFLDKFEFIEKCKRVHGYKYDYSLVDYKNALDKVRIICPNHGSFYQKASNHLIGHGCKVCAGNLKSTNENFSKKANIIHNNRYDYSLVEYKNALSKVIILCKEHGEFEQTPNKHLYGRGCKSCGLKYGVMENDWLDIIGIKKVDRQVKIHKYVVDGLDRINKIVYEFNGDFWHGNPDFFDSNAINNVIGKTFGELYKNTIYKEEYLKKMGYKIVSIWESEYLKLEKDDLINKYKKL